MLTDRLQRLGAGAAGALGGEEPQHVNRRNLLRCLRDDAEEHPQVVGRGRHRVRPAPAIQELQIVIEQRHPEPDQHLPSGISRTDQTRIGQRHLGASSSVDRAATTAGRNVLLDHVHNKQIRERRGGRQAAV